MKRSRFSEEQIIYAIRQAESGTPIGDLCRQLGVSEARRRIRRPCGSAFAIWPMSDHGLAI